MGLGDLTDYRIMERCMVYVINVKKNYIAIGL